MSVDATSEYDVLVMGSGLGGSITASILARKGWRVLLIDSSSHPRFAIGEATTPDISFLMKIMSRKYDVPEIYSLTSFHRLRDEVSSSCGIKKSFSFLYHNENETQNPQQSHQFPTLAPPMGPDCHLFRQDTDAYMVAVALKYGVDVRQQTRISEIDMSDDGVVLRSECGKEFRGRYLIDGCGYRSPLAQKFDLREQPTRLKTKSRALFTHMVGVKHFEDHVDDFKEYGLHYHLSEGTLHHMFDGGWMWVIPFNNHPEHTNPLCSVGILFDMDKFPLTDQSPEEEFAAFLAKFPSIAWQFEDARPVRDWVRTGRLQYSSSNIVGDRYCLLAHAGGFIDALYSTGLNLTMSVIDDLIPLLDNALRTDEFAAADFATVNDKFQSSLDFCDRMVHNSFQAFGDYDLWDAWLRVWIVSNYVGTTLNFKLFMNYEQTQDRRWLHMNESGINSGVLGSRWQCNREMIEAADKYMQYYAAGNITAAQAAEGIRSRFKEIEYLPPYFKWHRPDVRVTPAFTLTELSKLYLWYAMFAPEDVRRDLFDFKMSTVVGYTWKNVRDHGSRVNSRRSYVRDIFLTQK